MALNRDKTPVVKKGPKKTGKRPTKPLRVIQVLETDGRFGFPGGPMHFYHVRAGGPQGEVLYVSQNYVNKQVARTAAIREHSGRSNFEYVLEWTDGRKKQLIRETL